MTSFCKVQQFLCMVIVIGILDTTTTQHSNNGNFNQLYRPFKGNDITKLNHGDSESILINLDRNAPVNLYSSSYSRIHINTNGILTFNRAFPEYHNQPFPSEDYPAIAPFFSNVDTSGANDSTVISLFKTKKNMHLQKANSLISKIFPKDNAFVATILYVATWENVGYYNGKRDKLNTFQAVIICNSTDTYVQFIYPRRGINWWKGDGFPFDDASAKAGFVSEDGRAFIINESENDLNFSEMSNIGIDGVFLYRVGHLDLESNITKPVVCGKGWKTNFEGTDCVDIDECQTGTHDCASNEECVNIDGAFGCKPLTGSNPERFEKEKGRADEDCQFVTDCGDHASCEYEYTPICRCTEGYEKNVTNHCVPAGMCGNQTKCPKNAICKRDKEQYIENCECKEGYEGDGLISCKSKSSCHENHSCGVNGSYQSSRNEPSECVCNPGFHGNGYICEKDTCQKTPSMCDQNAYCQSKNNVFTCVCNPGYQGNGTICQIATYDSEFFLIALSWQIRRMPFDGQNDDGIIFSTKTSEIDKDCLEGRVYFVNDDNNIANANYDGGDTRKFITDDIKSPYGIAIDSVSRRIYWTDLTKNSIEVACLDDSNNRTVLVNNLVNPKAIAIDLNREKLYWVSSGWRSEPPKIEMSNLDGTDRKILLNSSRLVSPNSLVVLKNTGELCFADSGSHKIECIDWYSKNIRTVASNLSFPFGLYAMNNSLYWTDSKTKTLEGIDFNGSRHNGVKILPYSPTKVFGMTAVDDYCPQGSSPCRKDNGGCPLKSVCLANRNLPSGKSCK